MNLHENGDTKPLPTDAGEIQALLETANRRIKEADTLLHRGRAAMAKLDRLYAESGTEAGIGERLLTRLLPSAPTQFAISQLLRELDSLSHHPEKEKRADEQRTEATQSTRHMLLRSRVRI